MFFFEIDYEVINFIVSLFFRIMLTRSMRMDVQTLQDVQDVQFGVQALLFYRNLLFSGI